MNLEGFTLRVLQIIYISLAKNILIPFFETFVIGRDTGMPACCSKPKNQRKDLCKEIVIKSGKAQHSRFRVIRCCLQNGSKSCYDIISLCPTLHAPHHPENPLKFSQIHSKRGNMRNGGCSAGIVNIHRMFPKGRQTMNAKMMSHLKDVGITLSL